MRRITCAVSALAMLVTPDLARAHFAGFLQSGTSVKIAVTTVASAPSLPTAVTITEFGGGLSRSERRRVPTRVPSRRPHRSLSLDSRCSSSIRAAVVS